MEYPAVTRAQRRELSDWVGSGFKRYIELRKKGDVEVEEDALIRRYATEFSRIVCDDNVEIDDVDMPRLWADLEVLVNKKCPALDVVEFMLSCTSGLQATFEDCLSVFGLSPKDLTDLKECCAWSAYMIRILARPYVPGPFLFLEELLPEGVDVEAVRRQIEGLPDALTNFAHLLQNCPPAHDSWVDDFSDDASVSFFYLLLVRYGKGFPTLSLLLRTMRRVRTIVSPDQEYLHPIAPRTVKRTENLDTSGEPLSEIRDSFSETAIPRRVNRFFERNEGMREEFEGIIRRYFSDEFAEQRRKGETLGTLLRELWVSPDDAEASD
jgi:hypothetical protein